MLLELKTRLPQALYIHCRINLTLKRNCFSNPIHLPVENLMLGNIERVNINQVLCPLDHIDGFPEAFRFRRPSSDKPITINHIVTPFFTKLYSLDFTSHLHQIHGFACGTNSFQMSERFANPMNDASLLHESVDMQTAGNEDRVEHGGTHAFKVMLWLDTFATLALPVCENSLVLGADDDEGGLCSINGGHDAAEGNWVVTLCDEDGDAA